MLIYHNNCTIITVIRNSILNFRNLKVIKMATRLISQEDVSQACNELVKAGEQTSTLKVRKMLGMGSPNTIQKFIKVWRDSAEAQNAKADQLPAVVKLPEEFQAESELLLKKIFKLAEQEHAVKVEQIKQEREQAVSTAQAETEEALDYANGIDNENNELKESAEIYSKKITELEILAGHQKASNEELTRSNASIVSDLKDARDHALLLQDTVSKLSTSNALFRQECDTAKAETAKIEAESKSDISDLKAEHQAAINEIKTTHSTSIKDLKSDHKASIADTKATHNASVKEIKSAYDSAVKMLEKSLDAMTKKHDSVFSQLTDSSVLIADLKHENESLKTKLLDQSDEEKPVVENK